MPTAEQLHAIGITDPAEQAEILRFAGSREGEGGGGGLEGMIQRAAAEQRKTVSRGQAEAPKADHVDMIRSSILGSAEDDLRNSVQVDLTAPVSWGSFKSAFTGTLKGKEVSVLLFRRSLKDSATLQLAREEIEVMRILPRHDNMLVPIPKP